MITNAPKNKGCKLWCLFLKVTTTKECIMMSPNNTISSNTSFPFKFYILNFEFFIYNLPAFLGRRVQYLPAFLGRQVQHSFFPSFFSSFISRESGCIINGGKKERVSTPCFQNLNNIDERRKNII